MHNVSVLLVYDGKCSFCVRWARWMATRLPAEARVEPWQSLDLASLGLSQPQAEAAVWWIDDGSDPRRYHGAEAIGRALVAGRGIWKVAGLALVQPPLLWIARPIYTLVAANRHRLSGRAGDR